jgi:guanylate kinase
MAIVRAEHAKTERTIHNYLKMIGEWLHVKEQRWYEIPIDR